MDRLPAVLKAQELRDLVDAICEAAQQKKPVVAGIGGHVIKCGLGPLLIEAFREGWLTAVAMNGGASIHDFELCSYGSTSEEVEASLPTGMWGMVQETGAAMGAAITHQSASAVGLGSALGQYLQGSDAPWKELSVLAVASEMNVPVTVHISVGADTVHSLPEVDPAAFAAGSHYDFRLLAAIIADMGDGGVYLNIGSAVLLPEIFSKALNLARNVTRREISRFTTANLDMQQSYRQAMNVLQRPHHSGGRGIHLTGHHEIMVPLLFNLVSDRMSGSQGD